MPLMTGQQYRDSLSKQKLDIRFMGRRISDVCGDPATRPHVNAAAMTYDMAHMPEFEDLVRAKSGLTGEVCNRFTHIHQSVDDLLREIRMLRACSQQTASCYQRCVGHDAINALYTVTYEMDQKLGTSYHGRLVDFVKFLQQTDRMADGGMTDPKGDRSLAPSKQADPDLYLRVLEQRKDGIVVRGAKAHQTGAVNSHEFIAMPTTAMGPDDKDYAVSFAVPTDAPGLLYIFGKQTNDERKLGCVDQGNVRFGIVGGEALVVFEDVFVPWERVFMCGEVAFSGPLVERFAEYHRARYGACKGGVADILVGAVVALSEMQGTAKAAHIREKITDMVHLTESLYACSVAAAAMGSPTPSGAYAVNSMMANVCKLNVTRSIYEIARLAQDIAGGFIATLPSEQDLDDPEVGPYIKKYFKGVADVPTEHRIRVARLIENMTGGTALVESMHGAGSPQAARIFIARRANLEQKKRQALRLAGVDGA